MLASCGGFEARPGRQEAHREQRSAAQRRGKATRGSAQRLFASGADSVATDLDAQSVNLHQLGALGLILVAALVAARRVQLLDVAAQRSGVLGLQMQSGELGQGGEPQALIGVLCQSKGLGVDLRSKGSSAAHGEGSGEHRTWYFKPAAAACPGPTGPPEAARATTTGSRLGGLPLRWTPPQKPPPCSWPRERCPRRH